METTITGIVYLDVLQQFLVPQLDEDDQWKWKWKSQIKLGVLLHYDSWKHCTCHLNMFSKL
jgi:hypothetical protein